MSFSIALVKFIQDNLVQDDKSSNIEVDASLIEQGLLDSMGVLQIMTFIEEEIGIRIPDTEVKMENFQTVSSIEQMVQRLSDKTKAHGSS